MLGLGYAGIVLILGQLVGQQQSSLAVAGATLAMAALFQPLRRRIQQLVDRRFNRRRHDAAQTVQGFSTRLRDQIDLATLTSELLAGAPASRQPPVATVGDAGHAPKARAASLASSAALPSPPGDRARLEPGERVPAQVGRSSPTGTALSLAS